MNPLLKQLLGGKKKHKKKRSVGGEVADEVGDVLEDGCCLGGCFNSVVMLAVVGAGVVVGARKLKG